MKKIKITYSEWPNGDSDTVIFENEENAWQYLQFIADKVPFAVENEVIRQQMESVWRKDLLAWMQLYTDNNILKEAFFVDEYHE